MPTPTPLFRLRPGTTPLLISLPHVGTAIPDSLRARYLPRALGVEDTDWHLEPLYSFAADLGASLLVPTLSRFVIDLNRPADDKPMYPGAHNTELCPTRFFTGDPIYQPGQAPSRDEVVARRNRYWQPYHEALADELQRLKARFGWAILFDGHSIKSQLPWLFEGRLPDLNLGTADGTSCAPSLRAAVEAVAAAQQDFGWVLDGRFKGGYITRHYGRPAEHIHAVQLEMCWSCYMDEAPPWQLDPARVQRIGPVLRGLVKAMLDWRP